MNHQFKVDGGAWIQQAEPYLLLEVAQVHNEIAKPLLRHLGSAALGLRWSDRKHYTFDFAIAKPTGDSTVTNPKRYVRASLLLTYQLGTR